MAKALYASAHRRAVISQQSLYLVEQPRYLLNGRMEPALYDQIIRVMYTKLSTEQNIDVNIARNIINDTIREYYN